MAKNKTVKIVSIPLWFDSNLLQLDGFSGKIAMSQFHYGSIQISKIDSLKEKTVMSQFHYGSIQINLRNY